MKGRFIKQLQAPKSLVTLDGQRVKIPSNFRKARPRSYSRNARRNQLPEVDLRLGTHEIKYQLQLSDLKHMAITKQDWEKMQEHQIVENALAYRFLTLHQVQNWQEFVIEIQMEGKKLRLNTDEYKKAKTSGLIKVYEDKFLEWKKEIFTC